MDLLAAHRELAIRLYRWALREAEHEMEAGFPLVRTVQDSIVESYVRYAESLNSEDRRAFVLAGVTRSHFLAAKLLGETVPALEDPLIHAWTSKASFDGSEFLTRMFARYDEGPPLDKKRLNALLCERLSSVTGSRFHRNVEAGGWLCRTRLDDWKFETAFRIVPRTGATYVECYHSFIRRDIPDWESIDDPIRKSALTSFVQAQWKTDYTTCLGVALLHWSVPCADDEEPCAESLRAICDRFVSTAPSLLEGLNIGS